MPLARFAVALAAAILLSPAVAHAIPRAWTGNAGTSSWHDPDNWSPVGPPEAGDDVTIDLGGAPAVTVVFNSGTTSIASLQCAENLTVSFGTLLIDGASQIDGLLTFSGGTLGGDGTLTVAGGLSWTSGTMSGGGSTVIGASATATLSGNGSKNLNRTLANDGTTTWTGGQLRFNGGTLTNAGTLEASAAVAFGISGTNAIINTGTFRKTGPGELDIQRSSVPLPFANDGTVEVLEGILTLDSGPTTHTGPFTVAADATLGVNRDHTFAATATISGDGSLATGSTGTRTFGGAISLGGDGSFNGTNDLTAAPVNVAGAFSVTGGTTTLASSLTPTSVSLAGVLDTAADHQWPELTITSGGLTGLGTVTVVDALTWTAGTMSGDGTTIIAATASAVLSGNGSKTVARPVINEGTMSWTAGQLRFSDGTLTNTGTLEAAATTALGISGTNVITNAGTFRKLSSSTLNIQTSSVTLPFNNDGTVEVVEGRLTLNSGPADHTGPFTVAADATLDINRDHTFSGSATISGDGSLLVGSTGTRTFGGAVSLGGDLSLNGTNDLSAAPVSVAGIFTVSGGTTTLASSVDPIGVSLNGVLDTSADHQWSELTITAGGLTGPGTVTVSDVLTWTGGAMSGDGTTIIAGSAIATLSGNGSKTVARPLVNDGTVSWIAGQLRFSDGTLTNAGTLEASPTTALGISGTNAINNTGTFRKLTPSTLNIQTSSVPLPFNNDGTIEVAEGTLGLSSGPSVHTGPFTVAEDATLSVNRDHTFTANATISGAGSLTAGSTGSRTFGGAVTLGGDMTLTGTNDFTAAALSRAGALNVTGGTTSIASSIAPTGVTISGTLDTSADQTWSTLTLSNGTLAGRGTVTITDTLSWTSGSMSGSGSTILAASATGTLSGNSTKNLNRTLVNQGSTVWSAGQLRFNTGTLSNAGIFEASASTAFGISGTNAINNSGTFRKIGPSTLTIQTSSVPLPFNNDGTVAVEEGTLALTSGPATHTGPFTVADAAGLTLNNTHTLSETATITGGGSLTAGTTGSRAFAGAVTLGGDMTLAGTNDFTATTVSRAGALSVTGGTTSVANTFTPTSVTLGGTLDTSADQAWTSLAINNGGTLGGSGTVTVTETLAWTAGTMSGSGTTIIAATAGGTLSGTSTKNLNRPLTNEGTLSWAAGQLRFNTGTLTNVGTFDASATTAFGISGTNAINNTGTFRKTGPSTLNIQTSSVPLPFTNGGTVDVESGTLGLISAVTDLTGSTLGGGAWIVGPAAMLNLPNGASVQTLADPAAVTLDGDGAFPALAALRTIDTGAALSLEGGRTFAADPGAEPFTNGGTLTLGVGSGLAVDGELVQTAGGSTRARLDSKLLTPLNATGDVTLDGALTLEFDGGFTPTLGASTTVLESSGGAVGGAYATLVHPLSRQCVLGLDYAPQLVSFGLETEPPVAVCQDITVQLDASGSATITASQVDGGSTDNCVIASIQIDVSSFDCGDVGTNVVLLTVTDAAGNIDVCPAVVTVVATGQFIGPRGGSWFDAANWCSALPDLTRDVFLDATVVVDQPGAEARTVTVQAGGELLVGGETAGSIQVAEQVTVEAEGAVTIAELGAVSAPSVLIKAGGTLALTAETAELNVVDLTLEPGAILMWSGGTIEVQGTFTAPEAIAVGCDGGAATLRLIAGTAASPTLVLCDAGVLEGTGDVLGDVHGGGVIRPGMSPGELTIAGGLTLEEAGELAIEIAGLVPGTEHDVVTVAGDATLGGLLTVTLIDGFEPAIGDRVTVLTAAAATGAFDTVALPAPSGSRALAIDGTATGLDVFARNIADLNADGFVDLNDLLAILSGWGPCSGSCPADIDADGMVGISDLLVVLSNWGS